MTLSPVERVIGHAGFTLPELLITLAITGILTMIAAPSFVGFIKGQAVRTGAFDLQATLTLARSEAIKRNRQVDITPAAGGWKDGWIVTTTVNGASLSLGQQASLRGLEVTGPATGLTYGGDGRLVGASQPQFELKGSSSARCITVNLSGLPSSKIGTCA